MKRYCPSCGKPAATVLTAKDHATRMGKVTEEMWRCAECFKDFKLHSQKWDAFWLVFGVGFTVVGILIGLDIGAHAKPSDRTALTVLIAGQGIAAAAYSIHLARIRKRARPVPE
jgi:hypothetical protein